MFKSQSQHWLSLLRPVIVLSPSTKMSGPHPKFQFPFLPVKYSSSYQLTPQSELQMAYLTFRHHVSSI